MSQAQYALQDDAIKNFHTNLTKMVKDDKIETGDIISITQDGNPVIEGQFISLTGRYPRYDIPGDNQIMKSIIKLNINPSTTYSSITTNDFVLDPALRTNIEVLCKNNMINTVCDQYAQRFYPLTGGRKQRRKSYRKGKSYKKRRSYKKRNSYRKRR